MKRFKPILCALLAAAMLLPAGIALAVEGDYLDFNYDGLVNKDAAVDQTYKNGATPTNAGGEVALRVPLVVDAALQANLVDKIKITPVVQEGYPFVLNNAAAEIDPAEAEWNADFTLTLRDDIYTGIYAVKFMAEYRLNEAGTVTKYEQEFKEIYITVKDRPAPPPVNTQLVALNLNQVVSGTDKTYAKGFMPESYKSGSSFFVDIPIPLTGLSGLSSDVTITAGNDAYFKPTNGVKTVSSAQNDALTVFTLELAGDTYNGIYPATFATAYEAGGETQTGSFTIYIKVVNRAAPSQGGGTPAPQSQPRVMVSKYTVEPQTAVAGEIFTLTIELTNQSEKQKVQNIKVTLSNSGGEFLPADGTNTTFISAMEPGATHTASFRFRVAPDAAPRPASLLVDIAYEDKNASALSESASISIPVSQPIRIKVDEPKSYEASGGDPIYLSMNVYNLGKSTLYNLMATIKEDNLGTEQDYYGGNIEPGGTKSVELGVLYDAYALVPSMPGEGDGAATDGGIAIAPRDGVMIDKGGYYGMSYQTVEVSGTVVLTYEDADGKVYTEERAFLGTVMVEQPVYDPDMGTFEPDFEAEQPATKSLLWLWITLGCVGLGAVVVAVIVIVLAARKKKKVDDALL